jgi:hypothetical protein
MSTWYIERSRAYPAAFGYTGPLSQRQARREQAAWSDAGWAATLLPSTPEMRKIVHAWQHETNHRLGRCTCKAGAARWGDRLTGSRGTGR